TQLFGYMQDYGLAVLDVDIADNYYVLADFRSNGTKVYLPNSNCYLEMLTYRRASQQVIGNHQKAQLITFLGMDVLTAGDILQARDASIAQVRGTEGGGPFPVHPYVDVYNADLSRIRMIDLNY